MYDRAQFRSVISEILKEANLHSKDAVELLMLTAAAESNLGTYLVQQGGGPAKGAFQMEPATHDDIWRTHGDRLRPLLGEPDPQRMVYDLKYATIMSRMHYLRVPKPLPPADDVDAMAAYWKRYYNTELGAGRPSEAKEKYNRYAAV